MRLPTDAWHASFRESVDLPTQLRDSLFEIYAEVERLNTLAEMMLAGRPRAPQTGPNFVDSHLGLDRHGAGETLALRIRDILPDFEKLSPPEKAS